MANILALAQSWFLTLVFLITLGMLALSQTAGRTVRPAKADPQDAHGQLVGFRKNRVYLSAPGRAFQVEFLGTAGVEPQVISSQGPVNYPNLWPGISVKFERQISGATRAVYTLVPGANPGRIREKYSAPVEIQPDGGLRVRAAGGDLLEPAPRAWQLIEGQQATVPIGLFVLSGSEVGFDVGEFDPASKLIIER